MDLHLVLAGVVLPPPKPDILSGSPLDLVAHVDLDKPSRPVTFKLTHTLVTADGTAQDRRRHRRPPACRRAADPTARRPRRGRSARPHRSSRDDGDAWRGYRRDGGWHHRPSPAARRPCPPSSGRPVSASPRNSRARTCGFLRADIQGRALKTSVTGSDLQGKLDLAWKLALSDLSAASPAIIGTLQASGHVEGPQTSMAVDADISGDVGNQTNSQGSAETHRPRGWPAERPIRHDRRAGPLRQCAGDDPGAGAEDPGRRHARLPQACRLEELYRRRRCRAGARCQGSRRQESLSR